MRDAISHGSAKSMYIGLYDPKYKKKYYSRDVGKQPKLSQPCDAVQRPAKPPYWY